MKKKIADKWIAALKSGNYKQGKYRLHSGDCFCALGVLCDVAEKEGIAERKILNTRANILVGYYVKDNNPDVIQFASYAELDDGMLKWSGIKDSRATLADKTQSVANLNDNEDKSFEEIADFIKKNYKNL
jgi:predicted transcriptional regulator